MIPSLQHRLTNIYNIIDDNDEFREIRYFLVNSQLRNNESFVILNHQLSLQVKKVQGSLNNLSSVIDGLQGIVNECKSTILREQEKDPRFKNYCDKYYNKGGEDEEYESDT